VCSTFLRLTASAPIGCHRSAQPARPQFHEGGGTSMAHPWTRAHHGPGHASTPAPPRPRGRMTRQGETHHRITARGVCPAPGAGAGGRSGGSTTTTWSRRRGLLGFMAAQRGPDSPPSRTPSSQEILFGSHRVSGGDERGGHYHRAGAPEKSGGRILPMTRSRSLGSARLCYRLCLD
jgi:hypothetical protein